MKKLLYLLVAFALALCMPTGSLATSTETEFIGPIIASAEYIPFEKLNGVLSAGDYVTFNDGMAAIFIGYSVELGLQTEQDYPVFAGRDDEGNAELYVLVDSKTEQTSINAGWMSINVIYSPMVWWSNISK